MTAHFLEPLVTSDPLIAGALGQETQRQQDQIELIASENCVSRAVLDVLGHEITNKTLEGYPAARFHGGGQFVDIVEQAAIDRAKQLFGCDYVNVQPHSGSQANLAVFFAALKPGDSVLSLDLAAGGHLSHGLGANLSGSWFDAHSYGVHPETGLIDYDQMAEMAAKIKPALLIAGGSAYPRQIDFAAMSKIADASGALFLVDMAHFAGLVAGGAHPSPLPFADFVTCTTTKTLRGPRGGVILSRDERFAKKLQSAVFPGVQGSLHTQVLAAKAVCFGEALKPEFKTYAQDVVTNAQSLAGALVKGGIKVISGGTDTHIVLLDLSAQNIKGQQAEDILDTADITCNKNPVPFDVKNPADWVGLRLGSAAATTRGLSKQDFGQLGEQIARLILCLTSENRAQTIAEAKSVVAGLCSKYPVYRTK